MNPNSNIFGYCALAIMGGLVTLMVLIGGLYAPNTLAYRVACWFWGVN